MNTMVKSGASSLPDVNDESVLANESRNSSQTIQRKFRMREEVRGNDDLHKIMEGQMSWLNNLLEPCWHPHPTILVHFCRQSRHQFASHLFNA
jgi:hypothetical protein